MSFCTVHIYHLCAYKWVSVNISCPHAPTQNLSHTKQTTATKQNALSSLAPFMSITKKQVNTGCSTHERVTLLASEWLPARRITLNIHNTQEIFVATIAWGDHVQILCYTVFFILTSFVLFCSSFGVFFSLSLSLGLLVFILSRCKSYCSAF